MAEPLRVGIAGATGALGTEVLKVLDSAPWRPAAVVPLASRSTRTQFVDYGDERVAVDDLELEALGGLDAVIVCLPVEVARPLVDGAAREGVAVIDCSGATLTDATVPLVAPALNGDELDGPRDRDVVAVPAPPALLIASVLRPLVEAGIAAGADANVLVPASLAGRAGIDELSAQVIALFNSGTPPRRVFERGLAFDLLPAWDPPGATGWTGTEARAAIEIARLCRARVTVTVVGVPCFTGVAATLRVPLLQHVEAEAVADLLRQAGVVVSTAPGRRELPRPRSVDGDPRVHAGRLRLAPDRSALHLWLTMDNLRATAAAAATCCAALVGQGEGR